MSNFRQFDRATGFLLLPSLDEWLPLGLLIYGYATGVFSSRKLERATHDSVAFRFIAANDHPDHDTIATFRRRFLPEIEALFVKVLLLHARWARSGWAPPRWTAPKST